MVLDSYVGFAETYRWVDSRTSMMGGTTRVRRAPVGVVAAITPWNVPLFIAALKLAPAMVAGCMPRLTSLSVFTQAILWLWSMTWTPS